VHHKVTLCWLRSAVVGIGVVVVGVAVAGIVALHQHIVCTRT
jgi:hypothetical protein